MTVAPEKCPKCFLPKNPQGSGSLTQWLSSCACDRQPAVTVETKVEQPIDLCKICGKRSREGRVGSFTQFIFRYDLCACESPLFAKQATEMQQSVVEPTEDPFDDSEEAIAVEKGDFPINRYKPIELKGKGASGSVYTCRDRFLNKKVAVKILHHVGTDEIIAFQHEAQVLSKLVHPNIVKLLDFGVTSGGSPYMVLEHTDGTSLRTILDQDGPLTWEAARRVFAQLADGLISCHDRKIFHRDLKPENILFISQDNDYFVKLIDFGIAFEKTDSKTLSTNGGGKQIVGTPAYMAPDQAAGLEYDARSELYSFGCVLYEALTGQPPFVADSALELLSLHANATPPPLSDFIDSDMDQAEEFLRKCLAKNPTERFFSMKRVHEALTKSELESRIKTASEDNSTNSNISPIAAIDMIPPAAPGSGALNVILILMTLLLVAGLGTFAVFQLSKTDTKTDESHPPPKHKTEMEGLISTNEKTFDLIEQRPGVYLASGKIDKTAFERIVEVGNVKRLQFAPAADVDWKSLPTLSRIRLNELNLHFTSMDDQSVSFILPIRSLRHVNLSETKVSDEGIKTLTAMRHLRILSLSNSAVSGKCIKEVVHIPWLTNLFIAGIREITLEDLESLRQIRLLDKLDISGNPIGDEGAKIISGLKLTKLEANDCNFSDRAIGYLSNAQIMNLSIGANTKLTDQGIDQLQKLKDLQVLNIGGLPHVSKEALSRFKRNRPDVVFVGESKYGLEGANLQKIIDEELTDSGVNQQSNSKNP